MLGLGLRPRCLQGLGFEACGTREGSSVSCGPSQNMSKSYSRLPVLHCNDANDVEVTVLQIVCVCCAG